MREGLVVLDEADGFGDPWEGVDAQAVGEAARRQGERAVAGVGDMAAYLDAQVSDVSHRAGGCQLLAGECVRG
ncbi:hypothetical protein [Streptomyces sp. NPDC021212]|uniref:hypothetical protein n=1 Tax=Streptomyces sp. NPDC021212 TaxID=3365118 RepID=UPI0037940DEF